MTGLAGCGSNSERTLPDAAPPAVDTLTAQQIVTEAQRALSQASSVHITGQYREDNKPVQIDMRIAAGNKAIGTVLADGSKVDLRRIGDTLYVKGDDKFLAALGPKAQASKGKWLVGPVAEADRGLANLTDMKRFADTLAPGNGALTKEAVRSIAGTRAISVLSPAGVRLWVADTGPAYPLRVERIGAAVGFIDYGDYNAPVDVKAPAPTVDLASVTT
ncbi:MAG TPA: hypothetical protein VLR26_18490 [Frankiaceae bacterium]|nr:hypothetical protein [Frankiaceae bacterium]